MALTPSAKITSVAIGGAITTVLIWALREFGNVQLPGDVAAAVATVIGTFIGWAVPEGQA